MLVILGNPFNLMNEVFLFLQPIFPPKRFDTFPLDRLDAQKVHMRSDVSLNRAIAQSSPPKTIVTSQQETLRSAAKLCQTLPRLGTERDIPADTRGTSRFP